MAHVCEFPGLNKIALKQKFPMPRIDERVDKLQISAIYSTFDILDAFFQIPIRSDDRLNSAFHTHLRSLEYTCMAFDW